MGKMEISEHETPVCHASSENKQGVLDNMQKYCDNHKCDYIVKFDDGTEEEVVHGEKVVSKEERIAELQRQLKELE